ncbi:MBL fold metallo-hydrolase [Alkalicoccus chagannorensis]|uniref:MBL fold metallo-hydrolase n=1 Tax=Alkalicoccus chagannorensis TaxID=427072 RepID=UPI000407E6DF|nr:MBL fold metallo-hydrolase [Alkalicoccus chagannorensis]
MHVTFLGGAGEYGRSSFLLHFPDTDVLIDCGIEKGAWTSEGQLPSLHLVRPERLAAVFLTHSHADHTGALPALAQTGWSGPVYASPPTLEQIGALPDGMQPQPLEWEDIGRWRTYASISCCFGRAGHTLGACWFLFASEGKKVFFSGDYTMHSRLYPYDRPPQEPVDIAVLDGAAGPVRRNQHEEAQDLLDRVNEQKVATALHGPLAGKTQELLLFAAAEGMMPVVDPEIKRYTEQSLQERRAWFRAAGAAELETFLAEAEPLSVDRWLQQYDNRFAIYEESTLASGPMPPAVMTTGPKLPAFTGTAYEKRPYLVHPSLEETETLLSWLEPAQVVFTHTPEPEAYQELHRWPVVLAGREGGTGIDSR